MKKLNNCVIKKLDGEPFVFSRSKDEKNAPPFYLKFALVDGLTKTKMKPSIEAMQVVELAQKIYKMEDSVPFIMLEDAEFDLVKSKVEDFCDYGVIANGQIARAFKDVEIATVVEAKD